MFLFLLLIFSLVWINIDGKNRIYQFGKNVGLGFGLNDSTIVISGLTPHIFPISEFLDELEDCYVQMIHSLARTNIFVVNGNGNGNGCGGIYVSGMKDGESYTFLENETSWIPYKMMSLEDGDEVREIKGLYDSVIWMIKRKGNDDDDDDDDEMWGFGDNSVGVLCVGHNNRIKVPELIRNDVKSGMVGLHWQEMFMSNDSKIMFSCGNNNQGQIGRVTQGMSDYNMGKMNMSLVDSYLIGRSIVSVERSWNAIFFVDDHDDVYGMGISSDMFINYENHADDVLVLKKVPLYDHPSELPHTINCTLISFYFGSLGVILMSVNGVNRIYTYGILNLYALGRSFYYFDEDYKYPKEIDSYGEKHDYEQIISVTTYTYMSFFLTDIGCVYGWGWINGDLDIGNKDKVNPIRILTGHSGIVYISLPTFIVSFIQMETWYCDGIDENDHDNVCSGNGECVFNGSCECEPNYYGKFCQKIIYTCYGYLGNNSDSCSNFGICNDTDSCICNILHFGFKCQYKKNIFQTLMDEYWWVVVLSCSVLFVMFVSYLCVCICLCGLKIWKQKNKISKFSQLKDVDILIEESALEQQKPAIKINRSLFEIQFSEINLKSCISTSDLSNVFIASYGGLDCCFKVYRIVKLWNDESDLTDYEEFEKEANIMSSISFPSIIHLYGLCLDYPKIGIVMEYCSNGSIRNYISMVKNDSSRKMEFSEKVRILSEICSGMLYLHKRSIIHRDLKPDNVLVDEQLNAKITDFGLSRHVKEKNTAQLTKRVGTCYFIAPELVLSSKYDHMVDVYAFAISAYCIIFENFEPYGIGAGAVEIRVSRDNTYRPKIPKLSSVEEKKEKKWIISMMVKCWDGDKSKRYSFQELMKIFTNEMKKFPKKGGRKKRKGSKEVKYDEKSVQELTNRIKIMKRELNNLNEKRDLYKKLLRQEKTK